MNKLFDAHVHTNYCVHATGTINEYVDAACQKGLKKMAFTSHCPMPDDFSHKRRMTISQLPEYIYDVKKCRKAYKDDIEIILGLECDYLPCYGEYLRKLKSEYDIEYYLLSVHPGFKEFSTNYMSDDPVFSLKNYYSILREALKSNIFDCVAHFDIIRSILNKKIELSIYKDEIIKCLKVIKENNTLVEINTSALRKKEVEPYPIYDIIKLIIQYDISLVLSSDAHKPSDVGYCFDLVYNKIESIQQFNN